ncbi:MAG: hypothetical protein C5B55_03065 [Blastocatellia bacterium]|nr:MAG: hypothetical protein C5B55_03065 [Blastocatellia bacterium]
MSKGETYLILGGGGMIGAQVVHRICRELQPRAVIVCSRELSEVQEIIDHSRQSFPNVKFVGFGGDVFLRAEWNEDEEKLHLSRGQLMDSAESRADLFDDVFHDFDAAYLRSQLTKLILQHKPDVVVDSINTATAISYQDVYTGSEIAKGSFDELQKRLVNEVDVEQLKIQTASVGRDLEALLISQSIPQLIRHVLIMQRAMTEAGTRLYLKIGTTGTGGMGLNIPYTHSEDKPSARLMTKTAIGFAHTGLMFLMARTPGGPIVKELKPAAMVGYNNISRRVICERAKQGAPLHLFASNQEALRDTLVLKDKEDLYERLEPMQMVVIDTGENGLFTKGEFETITHMGQMEFITPEEIARHAVLEIKGSNTGYDVIAAVDSTVMNPTYRAGNLRHLALEEAESLERQFASEGDSPSVALGWLGPPEIGKLLWEAHLLKVRFNTLKRVLDQSPETLAAEISSLIENNTKLRNTINSVGLPILTPDGQSLIRGPHIRIPEVPGANTVNVTPENIDKWAAKGWVDLRPQNFARWRERFTKMSGRPWRLDEQGSAGIKREAYPHEDIRVGAVVGWIFNNEILGYRIK